MATSGKARVGGSLVTNRGRVPRKRIQDRVLSVAGHILAEQGYAALTMERVAAVSGVAKTTLYRRWPTKSALCMHLYLNAAGRELQDPNTGNLAKDLKHLARAVVQLQTQTVAGEAFIGLITEAHANPETRDSFVEFSERRREITRRVLKRGMDRGELRADVDVDLVIDTLGGAMTFRLLQCHAPLNGKFANDLVDLVLSGGGNVCTKRN
jgi:AcrR family transcriptional regulator